MSGIPPLRVTNTDGTFNQIPVFELELSGGVLTKLSPTKVQLAIAGAQGPSGPSGTITIGSGISGGASGGFLLMVSDNATLGQINSSAFQKSITFPLVVGSGGTGLASVISATNLIGFNSSDTAKLDSYRLAASDNLTILRTGTAYFLSALTATDISYARTGNTYIVLTTTDDLVNERSITPKMGLTFADSGAGSNYVIHADTALLVTTARTITASTGLTGGGALSADLSFSVNTNVRDKMIGFFAAGNLTTSMFAEEARIYIPFNMEAKRVNITATVAPTGTDCTVNLFQWNADLSASTALFADANRPTIGTTLLAGSSLTFDIPTLYVGSYLGMSIDQVGSTISGSNLTVTLIVRSS